MKYIITESQLEIISEIDRNWRHFEWADDYEKIKDKIIPSIKSMLSYSGDTDIYIKIYDSSSKLLILFNKESGELFFNTSFNTKYKDLLKHPRWLVHRDYLMSDVFESLFPDYNVKSVRMTFIQ